MCVFHGFAEVERQIFLHIALAIQKLRENTFEVSMPPKPTRTRLETPVVPFFKSILQYTPEYEHTYNILGPLWAQRFACFLFISTETNAENTVAVHTYHGQDCHSFSFAVCPSFLSFWRRFNLFSRSCGVSSSSKFQVRPCGEGGLPPHGYQEVNYFQLFVFTDRHFCEPRSHKTCSTLHTRWHIMSSILKSPRAKQSDRRNINDARMKAGNKTRQ